MLELPLRVQRILVVGASSDIGCALLRLLMDEPVTVGAHFHSNREPLLPLMEAPSKRAAIRLFPGNLDSQKACHEIVDTFAEAAGGIDALVQLTGHVKSPYTWEDLSEADWLADINLNLSGPFFLAQRAMRRMREKGGRIIFMSTASVPHGGGKTSMAYGVSKAGIECMTKGLAREGAPHNILVNALAPGFIDTKFHTRSMQRDAATLTKRAAMIPLKRAGTTDDVARMILYLLSAGGDYITGGCIAISGGDWL